MWGDNVLIGNVNHPTSVLISWLVLKTSCSLQPSHTGCEIYFNVNYYSVEFLAIMSVARYS